MISDIELATARAAALGSRVVIPKKRKRVVLEPKAPKKRKHSVKAKKKGKDGRAKKRRKVVIRR